MNTQKNIIDFEKKTLLALTKEELNLHKDAKVCCICGKSSLKIKIIEKLEIIAIIQLNIEAQHIVLEI